MKSLHSLCLISLLALSGCGFTPFLYKPDITQGNVYSSEQIQSITQGMSREQVRQILGTPAIIDPFHPDIDLYIFSFKSGSENRLYQRRFSVQYSNGLVSSVQETPLTIQEK